MKIALFLGAGASVPYGMPTTADLWDKIKQGGLDFPRKDLLISDQFPDIEHILLVLDQLFGFLRSRAGELCAEFMNSRPDNVEHASNEILFAAKKFNSHIQDSHRSKDTIEQLITHQYKWNPSNDVKAEKILGPLFDLVKSNDGHITIFTTNYDTVIENYCSMLGRNIECIDGFQFDGIRRVVAWNGKFAPQNDVLPTKVFLYKLRGSMSWLVDASSGQWSLLQKPNTAASEDRTHDMYIRPSLDTKGEATQKEPYSTILDQFRQALPSFDVCIVIGYSFRDPHISKELVKFAERGKILVLLSPTSAADFENNALQERMPAGEKGKWRGNDAISLMELGRENVHGGVCALNTSLAVNAVSDTIDVIKSIIEKTASDGKTAENDR